MNSKGVLFTVMAFLVILSVLSLNNVIKTQRAEEQHFLAPTKTLRVAECFENIGKSVIELKKGEKASEIGKRVIPFNYSFDENSALVEFDLPFKESQFNAYFDFLNLSEVMAEDKNYENIYSGLRVDVNTLKNADWGGSAQGFDFLLKPYCYEFSVTENRIEFSESKSEKCLNEFDFSEVKRIDLNLEIQQFNEDYNLLECSPEPCPTEAFNPTSSETYFSLYIDDSNCGDCDLGQKSVSMHFGTGESHEITLSCNSPECNSTDIELLLSGGISIEHTSSSIGLKLNHLFENELHSFELLDYNFSVFTKGRKIMKSNHPAGIGEG